MDMNYSESDTNSIDEDSNNYALDIETEKNHVNVDLTETVYRTTCCVREWKLW